MSSKRVSTAFNKDKIIDYTSYYQDLVDMGFPLLVYAGEFDALDGPVSQNAWIKRLQFKGKYDSPILSLLSPKFVYYIQGNKIDDK